MVWVECDYCGDYILRKPHRLKDYKHQFCDKVCYGKWYSKNMCKDNCSLYSHKIVICDCCGKEFKKKKSQVIRSKYHFCDINCHGKWISKNKSGKNSPLYKQINVVCDYCKKMISRRPSHVRDTNFCDFRCYGRWRSEIFNVSEVMKEKWKDEEYAKMMVDSWGTVPTKPELQLMDILNECFPNEFLYNGDGSQNVIIDGKIPDFVHTNRKIVVEMYGEWWHGYQEEYLRIEQFNEFGYKTLIIWDFELHDQKNVMDKLNRFMEVMG